MTELVDTKRFWQVHNLRFAEPYFRLEKCARIVNRLAGEKPCDLLDVGCGPAALGALLHGNIRYFGIDVALQQRGPHLLESNILESAIEFGDRRFDIVVAAGLFEYLGAQQNKKFREIRRLLKPGGRFVVTYSNFQHVAFGRVLKHPPYTNMKPLGDFETDLSAVFLVERSFPSSHNWHFDEPKRWWVKRLQMPLTRSIPLVSRAFAINHFFICSARESESVSGTR